jgi:UDP-GlcNAc:undecaprenyl-phosphate GlcNAc-1-phosphate transferase
MTLAYSLLPALVGFGVALLASRTMMRACVRIGWVDKPNVRKQHQGHVPLAGGLTIAVAILAAGALLDGLVFRAAHLWIGPAMVFLIGFVDDRYPIRARYRFLVQLAAALVFVIAAGAFVATVGAFSPHQVVTIGLLGVPFTIIGLAGLTNAWNMLDGLDGLAGGLVLIALCWTLVVLAITHGHASAISVDMADRASLAFEAGAVVAGAVLAFLAFNLRTPWRSRASMFLGDGGSMSLGLFVGTMLVYAASAFEQIGMPPVVALWIAAVPLLDITSCIVRRVLAGVTPMTPDRKHMHHLVMSFGLSVSKTVTVMHAAGFAAGLLGVVAWRAAVPEYLMFWSFVVLVVAYSAWSLKVWKRLDAEATHDSPDLSTRAALLPQGRSGTSRVQRSASAPGGPPLDGTEH